MGGAIAQELAIQMEKRLSKLIIHVSTAKWRQALLYGIESLIEQKEKNVCFETIFNSLIVSEFIVTGLCLQKNEIVFAFVSSLRFF